MRGGCFILPAILCSLCLFSGCNNTGKKTKTATDIASFWNGKSLLEEEIDISEDRFADFAMLITEAPENEAFAAIDTLFDRLKSEDEVAYYIYSGWIDGAFYNLLSPCRSAKLYSKAVERIVSDGVLNSDECTPFIKKAEWIKYNLEGTEAIVPGLSHINARTLVLVLDLSCPSCRKALESLASDPQWNGVDKMAICMGYGLKPSVPGWDYLFPENASAVFDIHMTPVYFIVAADGTVERGYTPAL